MKAVTIAGLTLSGLFLTQSSQAPEPDPVAPHPEIHKFTYPALGYPHDKEVVIELVPGSTIEERIYRRGQPNQTVELVASTMKTAWNYSMTPYYASYRDDETTKGLAYSDKLTEYKMPVFMGPSEHVSHRRLMDLMDSITRATAHVPFHDPQILCVKNEYEVQVQVREI